MGEAGGMLPNPTKEHKMLEELTGDWRVDCTYFMDPSSGPMKIEATERVEMLGPFWTVSRFQADMMGMPFEGRATVGFEPGRDRWISTWIDVMSPNLYLLTGNYDDSGKTLTMTGEAPSPMTGEMTTYRAVEERIDKDTRKFEMFIGMEGGQEHKMFTYIYKRA